MEFEVDHIHDAKNFPLIEINSRLDEIRVLPKPVIVYCLAGSRSFMTVNLLKQAGMQDVINGGGIPDMKRRYL
jgi:phage shock protein E